MEGHIFLIKQGSKRLSPCSPGYLQGRTAAERGGEKAIPERLEPTRTITQPLNPLDIPFPPSASTAGRNLAAVGLRGAAPAPGAVRTCTLPGRIGSQRVPVEAELTPLAVLARRVVEAAQAPAGHRVAVPHSIEIHIPMTLAGDAGMHGAPLPQGVPEKPIVTEFAAFSWGRRKAGVRLAVLVLPMAPSPAHPQPHLSVLGGSGCRPPPHCQASRCRVSGRGRGMACSHRSALRRGCHKTQGCSARRRDLLYCASTGSALRGGKRS